MKLNIYDKKEIVKTYETDEYDIMFGTIEDILAILDDVDDLNDNMDLIKVIAKNRNMLSDLLLDVFADQGITHEELRNVKLTELVPLFVDLFKYVQSSFSTSKN